MAAKSVAVAGDPRSGRVATRRSSPGVTGISCSERGGVPVIRVEGDLDDPITAPALVERLLAFVAMALRSKRRCVVELPGPAFPVNGVSDLLRRVAGLSSRPSAVVTGPAGASAEAVLAGEHEVVVVLGV